MCSVSATVELSYTSPVPGYPFGWIRYSMLRHLPGCHTLAVTGGCWKGSGFSCWAGARSLASGNLLAAASSTHLTAAWSPRDHNLSCHANSLSLLHIILDLNLISVSGHQASAIVYMGMDLSTTGRLVVMFVCTLLHAGARARRHMAGSAMAASGVLHVRLHCCCTECTPPPGRSVIHFVLQLCNQSPKALCRGLMQIGLPYDRDGHTVFPPAYSLPLSYDMPVQISTHLKSCFSHLTAKHIDPFAIQKKAAWDKSVTAAADLAAEAVRVVGRVTARRGSTSQVDLKREAYSIMQVG